MQCAVKSFLNKNQTLRLNNRPKTKSISFEHFISSTFQHSNHRLIHHPFKRMATRLNDIVVVHPLRFRV